MTGPLWLAAIITLITCHLVYMAMRSKRDDEDDLC